MQGFRGVPGLPSLRLDPIVRPGLSGINFHYNGVGGEPFKLVAYCDYTSAANRAAAITALLNKEGTIINLVDKDNVSFARNMVLNVQVTNMQNFAFAVGGQNAGKYFLEVELTLQPTSTRLHA
jgi:hypothetical protein